MSAVSVIVPGWGVGEYLPEALRSLQLQTLQDWEAIVIDDGDTAAVAAAVRPFHGDRRIRLLATDNAGLAAARNRGIAIATAPRVAMLDGDDRYRPDYLHRMAARLDTDAALGFVTCDATMFGTPAFEGRLFSELHPQKGAITLARVLRREFKIFGAAMVRREVLEQVGGYDAELRSAEDLDLWIRILSRGWSGALLPVPLYEYRRRADSLSASSSALARWVELVLGKAADALAGRPEQAAAIESLHRAQNELRIRDGLNALTAGRSREGVATLRTTDLAARSPKWRVAMSLFRLFPPLAGPVTRFYMRGQPFARVQQAASS